MLSEKVDSMSRTALTRVCVCVYVCCVVCMNVACVVCMDVCCVCVDMCCVVCMHTACVLCMCVVGVKGGPRGGKPFCTQDT